jgi:alkylhydroperoxidase family enzyme
VTLLLGWMIRRLGWGTATLMPERHAVTGYLARASLSGFSGGLDIRITLIARARAAQLSGCRWCMDRTEHDGRLGRLSPRLLAELSTYSSSAELSNRERAALAFVEAIAGPAYNTEDLRRARAVLSEPELAELTAIVAEHHCLDAINHIGS